MKPKIEPEILARSFCAVLREWLTKEQLEEVVARNFESVVNGYPNICHTHDFCDANQAMLDAWERVTGSKMEVDASNDEQAALLNKAWTIAKAVEFRQ